MPDELTYQELLNKYQDLQLRVTRFSATEQELINTRDKLDQELDLYKRLQVYIGKSLLLKADSDLLLLFAEAIVDMLEVEAAMIFLRDIRNPNQSKFFTEGIKINATAQELETDLKQFQQLAKSKTTQVISKTELQQSKHLSIFDSAIMKCFEEHELNYEIFFLGANSLERAASYGSLQERHISIFLIFAHQMQSVLANRKRSEKIERQFQKITQSEQELKKLSLIATKSKSGVIITDTYGRIEWINDALSKISGYNLEEIIGKKPKDFLHGEYTDEKTKDILSEALANKKDVEVIIKNYRKDGTQYYNQLEITSIFDEQGKHSNFIAIQKDITNEIAQQQEIVRINTRFQMIADSSRTGIWEWDIKKNSIQWNDILYDILGISKDSQFDNSLFETWKSALHQDDRDATLANLDKFNTSEVNYSKREYRIIRQNDGALRNCQSVTISERDSNGNLIRLLGSMQDITEQFEIQQNILQKNEELKKINAELDHFVYSISHDLRSPLLAIKGIASLLLKSSDIRDENAKLLNMMLTSASRLDFTIQEILDYSRNSRVNVDSDEFDVAEMVNLIFDDLRFSANNAVSLHLTTEGSTVIKSDKVRVGVLLKNIIGNSIKYRKTDMDAWVKVNLSMNNKQTTIVIEDNGEGISENHIQKVFDMFYRGTTTSLGTGLGLYICKEIVNKLKGDIAIQSTPGIGTSIKIIIPLSK